MPPGDLSPGVPPSRARPPPTPEEEALLVQTSEADARGRRAYWA